MFIIQDSLISRKCNERKEYPPEQPAGRNRRGMRMKSAKNGSSFLPHVRCRLGGGEKGRKGAVPSSYLSAPGPYRPFIVISVIKVSTSTGSKDETLSFLSTRNASWSDRLFW